LALAGGALLTWAWHGFILHPWRPVSPAAELGSDIAFAVAAIAMVILPDLRLRRSRPGTAPQVDDAEGGAGTDDAEGAAGTGQAGSGSPSTVAT
jgi:hypothetical protein